MFSVLTICSFLVHCFQLTTIFYTFFRNSFDAQLCLQSLCRWQLKLRCIAIPHATVCSSEEDLHNSPLLTLACSVAYSRETSVNEANVIQLDTGPRLYVCMLIACSLCPPSSPPFLLPFSLPLSPSLSLLNSPLCQRLQWQPFESSGGLRSLPLVL